MPKSGVILLVCAAALVGAWLFVAVKILKALWLTKAKRGAQDGTGPSSRRSLVSVLWLLPPALLTSAGLFVNAIVFFAAVCWYRVQGKPLPSPPSGKSLS